MKRCSTCNRTYEDGSLNYCLADGAPLVEMASEPTVVIPRPAEKKKGRLLLWLGITAVAAATVIVAVAGFLIYKFSGDDNSTGNSRSNRQSSSTSPKPKPSPTPSPALTANDEKEDEDTSATPTIEDAEETTPILWETAASGFKGTPGKRYTFQCPADGTARAIWGVDIYTDYSSICTAAVHVGIINLKDGGVVTIEYRPGRSIYGSSIRNDITSNSVGEHARSFVILTNDKE